MRTADIQRNTQETRISLRICLDGTGKSDIATGVGFLDHMLTLFARHGDFDLTVRCDGDTEVDGHHSVEDIGICLGKAFSEALGDKRGICRYGQFLLPMDETLALCAVDLSGRPYLGFQAEFPTERVGEMDTQMVREFFYAVSYSAMMNLHLRILDGENSIIWRRPCLRVLEKLWIWPRWKNPGSRMPGQRKEAYQYEL